VALEGGLAMSGVDGRLLVVALVALSGVAVVIALGESLGLRREPWALRAIIGAPLALMVVTTVVLVIEAGYRRGLVLP
jgi:hypothetical protein